MIRGYEVEKGEFVVVEDQELESLAPEKSQEIDLKRFVGLNEIDPIYFQEWKSSNKKPAQWAG